MEVKFNHVTLAYDNGVEVLHDMDFSITDGQWDSMVHSSGEALVTNNGKVNVNSKKAIAAAKLIMDMVNDGTALTFSSSAGITATKAALAGNSLVVTATASKKQQSGAWAFMKFLMSDKQTEK